MLADLRALHLGVVEREYRFEPARRWVMDFCIPKAMLCAEIEGAVWTQGRHTRGKGFIDDCEKYNHATSLGWSVFRFPTADVLEGRAKEVLKRWSVMYQGRAIELAISSMAGKIWELYR